MISSRRMFRRDDESGLTTLEWLLIVAAVAGLAALAVVLVQNVVDDTAEEISGSNARVTAALVAAQRLIDEADRNASAQPSNAKTYIQWSLYYSNKCRLLEVTYGDAEITATPRFLYNEKAGTLEAGNMVLATLITPTPATDSPPASPAAGAAVAHCQITT